jgi:hypothetical protein
MNLHGSRSRADLQPGRVIRALLVALSLLWPSWAGAQAARVNAPHFDTSVRAAQAAVFWFGRVDPLQNYADVRVAYTDEELWIKVAVVDQWLWQDNAASRTAASLETWDAASVFVDTTSGTAPDAPVAGVYRFVGELSWWRPRTDYQAAYVGHGTGWSLSPTTAFTTETAWRGDAPNNSGADRGWTITFRLPFSSLGASGAPTTGTVWRLGVLLHDRDGQQSTAVSNQFWPLGFERDSPGTWGALGFGLRPGQTGPTPPTADTYLIRQQTGAVQVPDAMVGGGSTCAEGLDFFEEWGSANHAHSTTLVVQNQGDIADWPCFSKVYIDFPLSELPAGRSVSSATLTLHQFGGSDPSQAQPSLIQVFTVDDGWDESRITWNNAPMAVENVAQSWVDVIPSPGLPWPGAARTWDLSWAVAQAYATGRSVLRLALYDADGAYHSGKYFSSSDTGDWNEAGRPALEVILADGAAPPAPPGTPRVISD